MKVKIEINVPISDDTTVTIVSVIDHDARVDGDEVTIRLAPGGARMVAKEIIGLADKCDQIGK